MEGESSSPEGGPDTPPNTPVTPSHKTTTGHHRQWRELEKSEPEPAACLGQHHHHQRHHYHDHHHHHSSHKHHGHFPAFEKKLSYDLQGICDVKASSYPSSIYSCYHAHWCVASTPSTPPSSPTPASPTLSSLSSNCSSEGELAWQQPLHPRTAEKPDHSTCKLLRDDDDNDEDADENSDQDHSGNLPNPGTRPATAADSGPSLFLLDIAAKHPLSFVILCTMCLSIIQRLNYITFCWEKNAGKIERTCRERLSGSYITII